MINLPRTVGDTVSFEAHGRRFIVKYHSRNTYWLSTDPPGQRRRWGTRQQILEDIENVLQFGTLPAQSGQVWEASRRHRLRGRETGRRFPRMTSKQAAALMLATLERNVDYPDMATQDAIDWMAQEFRGGRAGLLRWLEQESRDPSPPGSTMSVINYISSVWTDNRLLKRATGKTRDEWLRLID